jgi:hypothetical protein
MLYCDSITARSGEWTAEIESIVKWGDAGWGGECDAGAAAALETLFPRVFKELTV